MKPQNNTKALTQTSILTGLCVVIYLVAAFVPILDIGAVFVTHIPIVLIYLKHGGKFAGLSAAAGTLIILMFLGPNYATSFLLLNAITGIVIGFCGIKKYSSIITLGALSLATLISLGLCMKVLTLLTGVDFLSQNIDMMIKTYQETLAAMKAAGFSDAVNSINLSIPDMKNYIGMILPGMALATSVGVSFITYIITVKITNRMGYKLDPVIKFSNWYVPSRVAYPVMILVLVSMFMGSDETTPLSYAIRLLFVLVFTLNGLSTLSYYMKDAKLATGLIVAILLVALMFLQSIMVFVGLFDYGFNFRGLDSNRSSLKRRKNN
ncbi:MAG: DUF2232 domain-containing protein [Clostridium sp.]